MFLVLHGETELNTAGRAQGRCDSRLTEKGRREGEVLGHKLRDLLNGAPPRNLISSTLGRCYATAAIVAEGIGVAPDAITTDRRLDEVDLGVWECLTKKEIKQGWPEEMKGATDYDWYFRAPGGERYTDVERRLRDWLQSVGDDHARLIVVGHGIASCVLRGLYTGIAPERALQLDVDRDAVFVLDAKDVAKI